jgi:hypothetical protein
MHLMKLIVLLAGCVLFLASVNVSAQKQERITAAEKELHKFFESYAEDLRQHRREAIADRYDRRGTFFMGQGQKELTAFDSVKSRYLTKWKGPKAFEWKELSFEMLSPEIAAVLGKFEWQTADGKVLNFSYTGVLVKRDGHWRIRVEDESSAL